MSSRSSTSESRDRGFSMECRRNEGWHWSVNFVTTPSAPRPTRAHANTSGSSSREQRNTSPSAVTSSSPVTNVARPPKRFPPPWVAVAVAQIGKREITRLQLVVELPERHATLDGDGARVTVHRDDPVEVAQSQHAPVGAGDPGERVPGADDLDGLPRPLRPLDGFDDLELAGRGLDGRGTALLVSTPVAPAGPFTHRQHATPSRAPGGGRHPCRSGARSRGRR